MDLKIKLLICYHKQDVLLKDDVLTPIHVGRALAKQKNNADLNWLLENMIGDDTGDNISVKNNSYNELTSLYWAWKNYDKLENPDYIGLMHYRRHFIFDENDDGGVIDFDSMNKNYLQSIHYNKENIQNLFADHDFAYHMGKVDNIYKHYNDNHRIEDLKNVLKILKELYPSYSKEANDYLKQSHGCFCNMIIFPKKMFFEYCEWIFTVLTKFEKTYNTSQKRFFISERLTGIFIQKQINKGLKAKVLASSFIKSPCRVPVAIPFDINRPFPTAVTMTSFLETSNKNTYIDFYLLTTRDMEHSEASIFDGMKSQYKNFSITFINVETCLNSCNIKEKSFLLPEYYPLLLAELLPKVQKCLFVTSRIIILKDIEEFYRTCSVDDYWIVGMRKEIKYINPTVKTQSTKLYSDAFMLNLARLRDNEIIEKVKKEIRNSYLDEEFILKVCKNQIGIFPNWFYVVAKNGNDGQNLFNDKNSRGELQNQALRHTMLAYEDKYAPYEDIQGIYSNFWWNIASLVPSGIPFIKIDTELAMDIMDREQVELNYRSSHFKEENNNFQNLDAERSTHKEAIFKKTISYCKKHGIKKTLKKVFKKLFKR